MISKDNFRLAKHSRLNGWKKSTPYAMKEDLLLEIFHTCECKNYCTQEGDNGKWNDKDMAIYMETIFRRETNLRRIKYFNFHILHID